MGGPANTTYGENTGVLAMSNVHDPRVVRLAAVFAIILSFFPAVAGVITSIPSAIVRRCFPAFIWDDFCYWCKKYGRE